MIKIQNKYGKLCGNFINLSPLVSGGDFTENGSIVDFYGISFTGS